MSDWDGMFTPPEILRNLMEMKFTSPTPIQREVLPSAIRDRLDIIGAAETGSGKTLAFAIPIVAHILRMQQEDADHDGVNDEEGDDNDADNGEAMDVDGEATDGETKALDGGITKVQKGGQRRQLRAIIMTPTRELAMQIVQHIKDITKNTTIKCVGVMGGLHEQKQSRLLNRRPEIVVATPGRLWKLIAWGNEHLVNMQHLKFLVIDEVDRMMENKHFEEMYKIMDFIHSKSSKKKQIFVFSATLTFVHKKPNRLEFKKKKMVDLTPEDKLNDLKKKLTMSMKPKVIDLTKGQSLTAQKLVERKVQCTEEDKDKYLYYFLKCHPGRTFIFANSKDCVRRLTSLLRVLNLNVVALHADLNQKKRLKNLDKFRAGGDTLLVATDVAARGIDINDVQHVIHYQTPRTAETYVHRSGRTARSNKEGLSVVFVSPKEEGTLKQILTSLKKDKGLPSLQVNDTKFSEVKQTVSLAQVVEQEEHRIRKQKAGQSLAKRVDAMEERSVIDDEDIREEHARIKKFKFYRKELNRLLGITGKPKSKKAQKKKQQRKAELKN